MSSHCLLLPFNFMERKSIYVQCIFIEVSWFIYIYLVYMRWKFCLRHLNWTLISCSFREIHSIQMNVGIELCFLVSYTPAPALFVQRWVSYEQKDTISMIISNINDDDLHNFALISFHPTRSKRPKSNDNVTNSNDRNNLSRLTIVRWCNCPCDMLFNRISNQHEWMNFEYWIWNLKFLVLIIRFFCTVFIFGYMTHF